MSKKTLPPSAGMTDAERIAKLVRMNMIVTAAMVIVAIAGVVAVRSASGKKPAVVAVDQRRVMVPAISLDKPWVNEPRVVAFTEECIRKAYSHDFLRYGQTMLQAQECFTPSAAGQYATSMQPFFKIMDDKRMNMALTIHRPAQVTRIYQENYGGDKDVVSWDENAEVEISFEGKNERIPPTKYRIEITVRRVSLEQAISGLAIEKMSVGPAA